MTQKDIDLDPQVRALRLLLSTTTDEKARKELQAIIDRRIAQLTKQV